MNHDISRITKDDIMSLLGKSSSSGVLSVYVGLSPSDRHDPGRWLSAVRSGLKELGQRREGAKGLTQLLDVAMAEIGNLPMEARHRSLAYFRCLNPDWSFWRSLHMYVPDLFAFDTSPQVRHLVALLDESPVLGLAVISQDWTRVFTWREGFIEEEAEIGMEETIEVSRAAGLGAPAPNPAPSTKPGIPPNRAADRARRRILHLGETLGELGNTYGWKRLLLIGPAAIRDTAMGTLPDAWKRLLIEPVDRNLINAPAAEIGAVAAAQLHNWKRREELKEVEQLLDDANSGGRACVDLEECLAHLHERRVERLYMNGDLQLSGYRGPDGRLYARPPLEPDSIVPEPRLTERMVASALATGAVVVPLEGESATKLGLAGGVGARLRWKRNSGVTP